MKFKTFIAAMVATASMAFAANINLQDIFTDEGYAKAVEALKTIDATPAKKQWYTEYISLGPNFKNVNFSTISYAEIKSRALDVSPLVFDAFFCNMFRKNAKAVDGYLADTSFNDPSVTYKKFVVLPGRVSPSVLKSVNAANFCGVVLKGASSSYAAEPACVPFFKAGVANMIAKTDDLPREKALSMLRDLKRIVYKNIIVDNDWKQLLTDLEIKIQSLQ